jgi:hypothetical protein
LDSEIHILEKYYEQGIVSGYRLAEICAFSGRNLEAIQYLQEDFSSHDPSIIEVKSDPAFRSLHNDPSFGHLVLRIGLPPV